MDHRTGTDDDVIVDEQFIVRQQVQDRVLEDLYPGADADGPCESPMILTPALMRVFSPTTTSPVISAEPGGPTGGFFDDQGSVPW